MKNGGVKLKVKELKTFLNQYDDNTEIDFGVTDGNSGEWYNFNVEELCDKEMMGDNNIGIEFEENEGYCRDKSEAIIDDLREDVIAAIDKY